METNNNSRKHQVIYKLEKVSATVSLALEKGWPWLLAGLSSIYFISISLIAVRKDLENDELYTFNIAKLPSLDVVWAALATGAEQMTPFFYALTRVSTSLFGENNFALRFPAMLGFWIMCLCLFRFVAKRSNDLYGLVAMMFPLTTGAYYYTYEARPYGLLLGFSGLALICYQSLTEDGKHRRLSLAGFTISLMAAIASHYYAVLILIAFGCGEIARFIKRRRLDFSVPAAMIVSLIPLLLFLPLIKSAKSYSTGFWAQPVWGDAPHFYYFMLISSALPVTALLILIAVYAAFTKGESQIANSETHFSLPNHETATALGFLAIPFVAVAIAMFITHAFTFRYAIPATLGLGILVPLSFQWLLRGRVLLTLALIILLTLGFARRGAMLLQEADKRSRQRESAIRMLKESGNTDLPIAISDPNNFLIMSHYAPTGIRERFVYLASPEISMRYLGHDSIERGMFDLLKPHFGLNVQPYKSYLDSERPFLLIADTDNFLNWMLSDLPTTGYRIQLKARNDKFLLFLVSPNDGSQTNHDSSNKPR